MRPDLGRLAGPQILPVLIWPASITRALVVTDFAGGDGDRLWLAGTDLHTFADVIAHASYDPATGATTITHDGSDAIVLLGVGPNSLSAAEFIFT